jgi:hypothetical protein
MARGNERRGRSRERDQALDVEFDFLSLAPFRPVQTPHSAANSTERDAARRAARKCASMVNYCTFNIIV